MNNKMNCWCFGVLSGMNFGTRTVCDVDDPGAFSSSGFLTSIGIMRGPLVTGVCPLVVVGLSEGNCSNWGWSGKRWGSVSRFGAPVRVIFTVWIQVIQPKFRNRYSDDWQLLSASFTFGVCSRWIPFIVRLMNSINSRSHHCSILISM